MRKQLLGVAGALTVMLGFAGTASAFTAGTIPGGVATNDGLVPVYGAGTTSRAGWYGAQVFLVGGGGTATVTIEYFGSEAGYVNAFTFTGASPLTITTPGNTGVPGVWCNPCSTAVATNVAAGLLPFFFSVNSGAGTVVNGANVDGKIVDNVANFFATITNDPTGTFGPAVDLWLDDNGAGPDDNHDDMMIRLRVDGGSFQVVPIPAAAWLLGSGLLGLFGIARRRSVTAA